MPVAHVSTVCMDPTTPQEYFNVGDKFLCFGMMMNNSLINPNQVRAFNIPFHDNPFYATVFRIEADESFIPFTSKGTVIRF